jgi:thymidylate kinase
MLSIISLIILVNENNNNTVGEERYEKKEFQKNVKFIYENNLVDYYKSWIFVDADYGREKLEKMLFDLTFQHYSH